MDSASSVLSADGIDLVAPEPGPGSFHLELSSGGSELIAPLEMPVQSDQQDEISAATPDDAGVYELPPAMEDELSSDPDEGGKVEESPNDAARMEPSLTTVDLGDDLVRDPTVTRLEDDFREEAEIPRPSESAAPVTVDDQLRRARISISEGFRDDARKLLHRILFRDPRNGPARAMLKELQEFELGQLLAGDGSSPTLKLRPIGAEKEKEEALSRSLAMNLDSGRILDELERDLSLGKDAAEDLTTPEQVERFSRALEEALGDATPQDRIDLGVAFLEVDRPELAILQFRAARARLQLETESRPEGGLCEDSATDDALLSATTLLAQAYVVAGRGLEAACLLHAVIRDMKIPSERKLEFLYWLGRACESLDQRENAVHWYEKLRELDPGYRDIVDRLKLLRGSGTKFRP